MNIINSSIESSVEQNTSTTSTTEQNTSTSPSIESLINITSKSAKTKHICTPSGSLYYIPIVDPSVLPVKGTRFASIEDGIEMYNRYASRAGFNILKSTVKKGLSGKVKDRYIWCNRHGEPKKKIVDTLNKERNKQVRKCRYTKTGCRAHVRFHWVYNSTQYTLIEFDDKHNHELIPQEYMHLSRNNRKLKYAEQLFIYNALNANIGPTKAHQLYSNMKGSEKNVNGTVDDFRNWTRDLNVFINDSDSQMLVNKMEERKKYVPGFSFEYKTEGCELHSIFWADEVAKCNYREFSDIMSFDATYRTNRYNLMFVPFTGIDNHKKCVTFAAGLIRDEKVESYTWLLNCFMKAFEKEPTMVVTDQDKSMEIAIKNVFKTSKHRLCMWHITQKLSTKVNEAIHDIEEETEKEFKKRFDSIVWNMYIEPFDFESKWEKLMNDFLLNNKSWFNHMFEIRSTWIPAYFIETSMFGLMRTTSRSESENAFFGHFMKQGSNLINFMGSFDSAMLKQRSKQEKLDALTITTTRMFLTELKIERHAAKVYTHTIFEVIQLEIKAAVWNCSLNGMNKEGQCKIYMINEKQERKNENSEERLIHYKVTHNLEDGSIVCTCRHYHRYGLLCRHCFWVLKNENIDEIPQEYVLRRWRRDIIPPELRTRVNRYGNINVAVQNMVNEVSSIVDECMHMLSTDEKKFEDFVEKMKELKNQVQADVTNQPSKNKDDVIKSMIGVSKPGIIEIENPPVGRYKGCGKDKRLMSGKEKAIKDKNKRKNGCSRCGESSHNIRTCKNLPSEQEKKKQKIQKDHITIEEA